MSVCGFGMPGSWRERWKDPRIEWQGFVPNLLDLQSSCSVFLAPLRHGGGSKLKVLEAMAMARPVVLTPEAATGIAASDGEDWLICPPDPAAMCAAIEALLSHSDAPARIGAAARAFVLGHHGWEAMLAPLAGLLGMTGEGKRHAA